MGEIITIRHDDRNLKALAKRLRDVDVTRILVGYQGRSGLERGLRQHRSGGKALGIRMVDLATIHHFGTNNAGRGRKTKIPARPFMGVMGDRKVFMKVGKQVAASVVRGRSVERALENGGRRLVALIRGRIVDLSSPPLAESTKRARLRRRGDTTPNPLVDTGGMVRAVSSVGFVNGRQVVLVESKARKGGKRNRGSTK